MKLLFCLLLPVIIHAQWPGYFYAFTLIDKAGSVITTGNTNYQFNSIKPVKGNIQLEVLMCGDSATLRFYVGGFHGLDDTHKLKIVNVKNKEIMLIEFPSSLSGGENKFYRNLFAGNLKFKSGTYQIKLPATDSAWNNLQEKHFCPDYGGNDSYWDISSLQ